MGKNVMRIMTSPSRRVVSFLTTDNIPVKPKKQKSTPETLITFTINFSTTRMGDRLGAQQVQNAIYS